MKRLFKIGIISFIALIVLISVFLYIRPRIIVPGAEYLGIMDMGRYYPKNYPILMLPSELPTKIKNYNHFPMETDEYFIWDDYNNTEGSSLYVYLKESSEIIGLYNNSNPDDIIYYQFNDDFILYYDSSTLKEGLFFVYSTATGITKKVSINLQKFGFNSKNDISRYKSNLLESYDDLVFIPINQEDKKNLILSYNLKTEEVNKFAKSQYFIFEMFVYDGYLYIQTGHECNVLNLWTCSTSVWSSPLMFRKKID